VASDLETCFVFVSLSGNLVKDENGELLANSHRILNRWKNYYSHSFNVHRVSDVRQIEIHIAEPLGPDPSPFEFEIVVENLKRYKSPGSNKIPAGLIQTTQQMESIIS
jgi:hypothetical protein